MTPVPSGFVTSARKVRTPVAPAIVVTTTTVPSDRVLRSHPVSSTDPAAHSAIGVAWPPSLLTTAVTLPFTTLPLRAAPPAKWSSPPLQPPWSSSAMGEKAW